SAQAQDFARFQGFLRVTPQMWKSMTTEARAQYIISMRLMWEDANRVLKPAPKKSVKNSFEKLNLIVGEKAQAAAKKGSNKSAGTVRADNPQAILNDGKSTSGPRSFIRQECMVAGYVGTYDEVQKPGSKANERLKTIACSVDSALAKIKERKDPDFVLNATQNCQARHDSRHVACNPLIYGMPKNGGPACISKDEPAFQTAMDFPNVNGDKTCDGNSRLTTQKAYEELKDVSGKSLEQRNAIIEKYQKAEGYKLSEDYIDGIFKSQNKDMKSLLNGKWTKETDKMLIDIQATFEKNITEAMRICEAQPKDGPDKNQQVACDQLHRRWLFTEKFIAEYRTKACSSETTYIGKYDSAELITNSTKTANNKKETSDGTGLCKCNKSDNLVAFGKSCSGSEDIYPIACTTNAEFVPGSKTECRCTYDHAQVFPIGAYKCPPAPTPATVGRDCAKEFPGANGYRKEDCICNLTTQTPTKVIRGSPGNAEVGDVQQGADLWTCEKSATNFKPWIIGALVVGGLAWLFSRSKKENPPVVPVIPPPVSPIPSCAPQSGIPPNCFCPLTASDKCTAGQNVTKSTCKCEGPPKPVPPTNPPTPPPIVNCDNGKPAPKNERKNCLPCWDGTPEQKPTPQRPDGCPPKTETKPNPTKPPPSDSGGVK
ncbi:MAG: hypothetical protein H7061_02935, partial [Bdellovibrionaceae bacterium]|nr:hypothetical protein [Bdellovibrio sp.]